MTRNALMLAFVGFAWPMAALAARTEERVQQIQALASCQEGDLSCPAPR